MRSGRRLPGHAGNLASQGDAGVGGAEGNRTPDLLIANEALSQLSYGPRGNGLRPLAGSGHLGLPPRQVNKASRSVSCETVAIALTGSFGTRLVRARQARYMWPTASQRAIGPDARPVPGYRSRPRALYLSAGGGGGVFVADRLQCGQYAQPVRPHGGGLSLPYHRAGAAADSAAYAQSRRDRYFTADPGVHHHLHALRHQALHHTERVLRQGGAALAGVPRAVRSAVPWTIVPGGVALTVRLTPRGGRDAVDGIEVFADGRCVLKARVRAPASEGEANAGLVRLIARALGVAPSSVTLAGGATARIKRLTIAGQGAAIVAALEKLVPIS